MNHKEQKKNEAMKTIMKGGVPDADLSFFMGGGSKGGPVKREVGEEWEDKDGKRWIQRQGYAERVSFMEKYRVPMFCPECSRVMKTDKDTKMWYLHEKCLNCVIDEETEMRINGTWKLYEKRNLLRNMEAYLRDAEQGTEDFLRNINNQAYVNERGLEKWSELSDDQIEKMRSDIEVKLDELRSNVAELKEEIKELELEAEAIQ